MATIAELIVKIGANSSELRKELQASQRQIKRAFGSEALAASQKAAGAVAAFVVAITGAGVASISLAGKLRMTQKAFETLTGSAQTAKDMISDLKKLDDKSAFDFDTYAKGAQKLLALGIAADQVVPTLTTIGDASAALGQGSEGIDRIVLALSQMTAKGKVSAQEMNQLAENNVQGWRYLADALGYAADDGQRVAKVMKLAEDGAINGSAAVAAILAGMEADYKGTMDRMENETPIVWGTIVSSAQQILAGVGPAIDKAFGVNKKLQALRDYLVQFKQSIESVGIGETLKKMVPPGVAASIVVLSGAITGAAIPSLLSLAKAAALALIPLAPYIAVGAAVAAAIWLLWKPVSNVINYLKQFEAVCYIAKFAAVGLAIGLISSFGPAILTAAYALFSSAIPALIGFATAAWAAIAPILPFVAAAAAIGAIAFVIIKAWKPIGQMFVAIWSLAISWAKRAGLFMLQYQLNAVSLILKALKPIADIFGGKIAQTVDTWTKKTTDSLKAIEKESQKAKEEGKTAQQVLAGAWKETGAVVTAEAKKIVEATKSVTKAPKTDKPEPEKPKTPGLLQGSSTEEELEKIKKKAEQVSDSIKQEWVQTTKTELEQLGIWKEEQLAALEETKSANENYQRDVERVDAVYATRRTKILQQEAEDAKKIWDQATDSAQEYQRKSGGIGLKGVDKQKYDIETDAAEEIENIQRKYRDWATEYSASTDKQKEEFRKAWEANSLQFEITEQGMVDFSKQADAEILTSKQEMNQEIADLHYERTKYQEELDEAYNDGQIERYKELLASEQAMEAQKIEGQKAMMDEYKAWWEETHRTMVSYMAEALNGLYSGLENFFVDIINNAKSIGDAWQSLKNSILSMLGQMVAKWLASQIMMAVFGKSMQATSAGVSAGIAATTAAAWAPAAAMVSLATYGSNAAAAMAGIAATYGLSMGLAAIPGFASGGQIKGPGTAKSDSIWARLSDGEYVMQASSVRKFGSGFFDMLNMGKMPAFAVGGLVTGPDISTSRNLNVPVISNRAYEKAGSTKQERQPFVFSPTIQAMDAKSFKRWLDDGGGDAMVGWMRKAYGEFVPVEG